MCFLHKFHFEMLYVLEWPKNRNWLALEFPDRGVGAGLAPARSKRDAKCCVSTFLSRLCIDSP